ncbi:MAG: 30S ribosomal protein S9 [Candidatus Kerfeldbacteria bacterium]
MVQASKRKRRGYTYAVGRRKTSTARVRFYKSEERVGEIEVNGKKPGEYFAAHVATIPKEAIDALSEPVEGYFTVRVTGGGSKSQAEAVRHGIAQILILLNEDSRAVLRKKGFVTRDPRMKERKKPGLKRARRAPQWSKR